MWKTVHLVLLNSVMLMKIYECTCQSVVIHRLPNETGSPVLSLKNNTELHLSCSGLAPEELNISAVEPIDNVEHLVVNICKTSKISYVEVMQRYNINVKGIKSLYVTNTELPFAVNFDGLNIETLTLNFYQNDDIKQLNLNVIASLVNLTKVAVSEVDVLPFPNMNIDIVVLRRGKSLGAWGGFLQVRELYLWDWNLEMVTDNWLVNCTQLKTLMIWGEYTEDITESTLKKLLEGAKSLQIFTIDGNDRRKTISKFPKDLSRYMPQLQQLQLVDNDLNSNVTLSDLHFNSLILLNLSNSKIFELQGLPVTTITGLEIDVRYNEIKEFYLTNTDYEVLKRNKKTFMWIDAITLKCDCHHAWLARAVRKRYLYISRWISCTDGGGITTEVNDVVDCTRFECGNCTCRRRWSNDAVDAYCSDNATSVPRVQGLRALYAADNLISNISPDDFPETLLMVNLTRNQLPNINKQTLEAIFNVSDRRIQLAGNPFVCGCSSKPLLEALQAHYWQVVDYENITCLYGGQTRHLFDIELSQLCLREQQVLQTVLLAVSAALIGVVSIAVALYFRYTQNIKMFLYARGCCLRWLHEEEIDCNLLYDAFISFSHHDEEFVMNKLLPILDQEYKLCIHSRDWVVGEFIPTQITRSVQQSKRTIVILSKNFMESIWGLLEFRTAHINAIQEGRTRIILIVLDDVIDGENLDSELRSYIRSNTYVRWGDKWFWDKLRYAMPHRKGPSSQPVNYQPVAANHEPAAIMMSPVMQLQVTPES